MTDEVQLLPNERWVYGYEHRYAMTQDRCVFSYVYRGGKRECSVRYSARHPRGCVNLRMAGGPSRKKDLGVLWDLTWGNAVSDITGKERWIPGFPGKYSATKRGDVYTYLRGFRQLLRGSYTYGYKNHALYRGDGTVWYQGAHRLVLLAFVGPCPDDHECRHLNGVRDDNRLENLTWGTVAEQIADKKEHGTLLSGEMTWNANFTDVEAQRLRICWEHLGVQQRELIRVTGFPKHSIHGVVTRKLWNHLPEANEVDIEDARSWWGALPHVEAVLREPFTATETWLATQLQEQLE